MVDVLAAHLLGCQRSDPTFGAGFRIKREHRVGFGDDRLGHLVARRHVKQAALVVDRDRREHHDPGGTVAIRPGFRRAQIPEFLVDGVGLPLSLTGAQVIGDDAAAKRTARVFLILANIEHFLEGGHRHVNHTVMCRHVTRNA